MTTLQRIFLAALILSLFGALYNLLAGNTSFAIAYVSVVIACFSVILAIESQLLGEKSMEIAIKSDEKMKLVSNVQFLNVVNMLEDARIEFNKTLTYLDSLINPQNYTSPVFPGYSPELFTWKTLTCVEMAVELIKRDEEENYISYYYKKKLFYYFNMSFKHLFKLPPKIWKKEGASLKHLIQSYAFLDDYYIEPDKTELKDHIDSQSEDYFKSFYEEVEKFKESDNFKNRIALT